MSRIVDTETECIWLGRMIDAVLSVARSVGVDSSMARLVVAIAGVDTGASE
jgi:hypothetical protein